MNSSPSSTPTVLSSLNSALLRALQDDLQVFLLGEDILDPYGGAFKVTQGCSTAFPDRVLTTPISEAGFVGVAGGMALRGLRPVVEIMFGDFLTLAADQVINHLAKFRWMYNEQVRVPVVIRTPMGGRRGYGPTHSQSLEKLFLGIPGLSVLAPNTFSDPGDFLYRAILEQDDPLLFVEHKLLYPRAVGKINHSAEYTVVNDSGRQSKWPTVTLSIAQAPQPTLTLAAYGYMAELALEALTRLAYEYEFFAELVVPTCLAPLDIQPVLASVYKTGKLLTIEEGAIPSGWGSEVISKTLETAGPGLQNARRIGARHIPVPASAPLEEAMLPGVDEIIAAALNILPAR